MDFSRLQAIVNEFNSTSSNVTTTSIPSTVLELFIPGYSTIAQLTSRYLGFDIGVFVTGWLVLFGLCHGAMYAYGRLYHLFIVYYRSSITIDERDILYDHVMNWIAVQRMTTFSRHLTAATRYIREVEDLADVDALDEYGIFNYGKWAGNIPPVYQPTLGEYDFHHAGQRFTFARVKKDEVGRYNEQVVLSCFGRDNEPIKQLLVYIKRWSLNEGSTTTTIYQAKQDGSEHRNWKRQSKRPSRPLNTVSLDQEQKGIIVADINEYLNPATARWYAARGIPHRRGYLFHGPPGTGKTSLSFSLAGIFGLDVYCLSLNDGISESELSSLFADLPRRCFLLLEDIDAAGIQREGLPPPVVVAKDTEIVPEAPKIEPQEKSGGILSKALNILTWPLMLVMLPSSLFRKSSKQEVPPKTNTVLEPPKEPRQEVESTKSGSSESSSTPKLEKNVTGKSSSKTTVKPVSTAATGGISGSISLSGLLNVIDGAASHEGHVLIMTTNTPDKLDDALTRPGRVDLQIGFTLATRDQIRDTFMRMFSAATAAPDNALAPKVTITSQVPAQAVRKHNLLGTFFPKKPIAVTVESSKLAEMAQQFADALPEETFSPAEIQGYLLMYKMEPAKAIEQVGKWKDETLEAKKKKENNVVVA
jgi:chaperone BCS1